MSYALQGRPTVVQLHDHFPTFYGTQKFNAALTCAIHGSLLSIRKIQFISHHSISPTLKLLLADHLRLGLTSGLFPPGFATNNLYAASFSHSRYVCYESYLPWLHNFNYTWRRVHLTKMNVTHSSSPVCLVIPFRFQYSPQQPLRKHPQNMFLP
jgi:hypothetical protein